MNEWILFIDGRSGSGKTSYAAEIAQTTGANTLHLEDLYPGWGGLAEGSKAVARALRTQSYRVYNWHTGAFEPGEQTLPQLPLIIEGCGAITPENLAEARRLATDVRSVWIECPEVIRKQRVTEREGDVSTWWQDWAMQEETHLRAHSPERLASQTRHC